MENIILASASPRRRELLQMLGLRFTVCPSDKEEALTAASPRELVEALARQKAEDIFSRQTGDAVVIGSDTVVSAEDGTIFGKPADAEDAARMLRQLSGRRHRVSTGAAVYVRRDGRERRESFVSESVVWMDELSPAEIEAYIASGEPMDKAGAYGIQGLGAKYISRIEGDYYTVVGLPVHELYKKLKEMQVISV
ncbi:MAG: Maf family protein [Lachnospiraceae bacterium]|nr:Maf family protein [Lachnospiraceae bacterium]